MSLPAGIVSEIERHGCFSGSFGNDSTVLASLNTTDPLEPMFVAACEDCLSWRIGALKRDLPAGTSAPGFAAMITRHLQKLRGFAFSVGGYHAAGPGFWLSAAYYDTCGVFLVDGSRSRSLGSDLEILIQGFRSGVLNPPDSRMLDPRFYSTRTVYVDFSTVVSPVLSVNDLLSSPQCRLKPTRSYHRVTLAEFLPISSTAGAQTSSSTSRTPAARAGMRANLAPSGARAASGAAPRASAAASSPAKPKPSLVPGSICPVCHAEVKERPLFNSTYIGCLC